MISTVPLMHELKTDTLEKYKKYLVPKPGLVSGSNESAM
jgi:hypothetical protein